MQKETNQITETEIGRKKSDCKGSKVTEKLHAKLAGKEMGKIIIWHSSSNETLKGLHERHAGGGNECTLQSKSVVHFGFRNIAIRYCLYKK